MGQDQPGLRGSRDGGQPQDMPLPGDGHAHDDFYIADDTSHPGSEHRLIDNLLLGQVLGTAMDRCTDCRDPLLTLLAEDAATTGRLVELACIGVHQAYGGLPAAMTEDDAGGICSPEFTRLARASLTGVNQAMFTECERMTTGQRRQAANTALDTLVGFISIDA
ncbi:hypothetical protein OV450_6407 [Actinobacteria bacterium OV450]|nr:hypothetical protein OV450_6407 [Actinobacteria bacterium OV450]